MGRRLFSYKYQWFIPCQLKLQTDLFYHSFTGVYGYFLFSIWDSLQKNISKAFKSSNLPSHFCLMHAYCLSSHVFVRHYWLLISPFLYSILSFSNYITILESSRMQCRWYSIGVTTSRYLSTVTWTILCVHRS